MALDSSIAAHDGSPAGSRPIRRRSVWAAPVLVIVQLGILAGFAWEMEPLLYQPVRGQVVTLEIRHALDPGAAQQELHRHRPASQGEVPARQLSLRSERHGVPGLDDLAPPVRGVEGQVHAGRARRTGGSIITVFVAPWAPDHAPLVRAPNFAILFILTIALFFASILSAAARSRR